MQDGIKQEYNRWLGIVGANDDYQGAMTLGIKEVLKAHFLIADFFLADGKGLGGVGPKSLDLLHSAIYRPHMCYGGVCKWTEKNEVFATQLYGLVMDHPFHDANKRTALLCLVYLLQKNGYMVTTTKKELEDFLVEIAEHEIENKARYQEYRRKCDDPEVKYIAWWLKENTRALDNRQYIITYRDLRRILNRFNCDLENAYKNHIDVVQYLKTTNFFGQPKVKKIKRGTIGFPGYTKQIQKGDLRKVREMTDLTPEKGCDSHTFYRDEDPLNLLISEYQEPLRRLADR